MKFTLILQRGRFNFSLVLFVKGRRDVQYHHLCICDVKNVFESSKEGKNIDVNFDAFFFFK